MFPDDKILFYSHHNIKTIFTTVNSEVKNIHEWFKANKLSLNNTKIKYSFFHISQRKNDIPLRLPKLHINNTEIKILGVFLHEESRMETSF